MKPIFTIILLLFSTGICFSQTSYTIDTVYHVHDSTVVFVQEFIDTTLMQSYHATFNDPINREFRYGFLRLKKGMVKEYTINKKWNIKEYNWRKDNPGFKGSMGELVITERIK